MLFLIMAWEALQKVLSQFRFFESRSTVKALPRDGASHHDAVDYDVHVHVTPTADRASESKLKTSDDLDRRYI